MQPEYTYNTEFSLGFRHNKVLSIESHTYLTYYDQAIVVRDAGLDSVFYEGVLSNVQVHKNAGKAYLFGSSPGFILRMAPFTFQSSPNFTYGNVLEENGTTALDHIPPFLGKSQLRYQQERFSLVAEAFFQSWKRLNRFSPRDLGNLEFVTPEGWPAWAVFNLRSEIKISRNHHINLGVENLADLHYRIYSSRISAAGRNIYAAFRLNF